MPDASDISVPPQRAFSTQNDYSIGMKQCLSADLSREHLALLLKSQLRQNGGRRGLRLRPERDLAALFGVNYMFMRRAVERLVDEGILTRKHGSGTYLRKVPDVDPLTKQTSTDITSQMDRVFPLPIFVAENRPTRLQPLQEQAQLRLGFLGSPESANPTYRSIERGILEWVEHSGHQLIAFPTSDRLVEKNLVKNWKNKLEKQKCDGLIMELIWADIFERNCPDLALPKVYIWSRNVLSNWQPLIQIDLFEAVSRSVRTLAEKGHHRIAFLDFEKDTPYPPEMKAVDLGDSARREYQKAMESIRSDYSAHVVCTLNEGKTRRAISRLFAETGAPTAIYVGDDFLLHVVVPILQDLGLRPGENVALITHSTRGNALPEGRIWSRMEFDPISLGRAAVDSLLREIETAGDSLVSFAHRAAWKPGDTHQCRASDG